MSKPAPAKPNFFANLMLMLTVFLGVTLWQNSHRPDTKGPDAPKNSVEILAKMQKLDAEEPSSVGRAQQIEDETVRQLLPSYKNFIGEEAKAKRITEAQQADLEIQATILAAHVQVKEANATRDVNKLRVAYNTLEPLLRTRSDQAAWNKTPVAVTENGRATTIVGADYMNSLIETISEKNKSDLIWGAIPGGYGFIDFLVGLTGRNPNYSYALAALLLALVVRGAVYPLTQKQLLMSRKMSQLTPRLKEIKEQFKDDQIEANKRSMELYGRYGINPFSGCLPALIQLPLFYTIYQCILRYQFEFTKGYFLWINPRASLATHGILAPNLGQQDYLLIAIYSVTMIISTLLTPVTDPTQAKQQRMIGVAAAVMFPVMMCFHWWPVVSGFVLYWTFTNLISMAQSIRAYRMPMPELVEVNAPGGGVYPSKPKGKWGQWMEDMQKMATEQQHKPGSDDGPSGGSPVKPKPKGPTTPPATGKVSPSRPIGGDGGTGGTGTPAKHKPKKRG